MKKIWIGTNWKMTKGLVEGTNYTKELSNLSKTLTDNIQLFIIPSYPFISHTIEAKGATPIKVGAQNMHWEDSGAYTGEVSPTMLKELNVDLVELGHSERREYYNENDIDINKKVKAALKHHIQPLICIGENLEEKTYGVSKEVLTKQMKVCLNGISAEDAKDILIAYEPVWAIGEKGIPADASYVNEVHELLRAELIELYGELGKEITLLYGGSVNTDNYLDYIGLDNVDGLFIGRAAWDMVSFTEILSELHRRYS